MSEQNGKVCCNCRHDIRTEDKSGDIKNTCNIDGSYIGYVKCMTGWCRHWSKDKVGDTEKAIKMVKAVWCMEHLEDFKKEIDEKSEIHSDGEIYIKNFDVKRIIDKYLREVDG